MRLVETEAGDAKLGSGKNVPNVDRLIIRFVVRLSQQRQHVLWALVGDRKNSSSRLSQNLSSCQLR